MRLVPAALVCAAALLGALLLAPTTVTVAGTSLKVATPLLRADPATPGQGSISIADKGGKVTVTFAVAKLSPSVAAPLGVFLEDGVGDGNFTQVASIATLKKGGGKVVLSSTSGPPAALGIGSLDDLVGRRFEMRTSGGAVLLRATVPVLAKFQGTKASAPFAAAPGSPLPGATAKLSTAPSASKGTEKFVVKAKGLTPGAAYSLFMEDAIGSGVFVDAGAFVGSVYSRDTGLGESLPLGAATVADLLGRAVQVRDAMGTPVVGGAFFYTTPDGTMWPFSGVVTIEHSPPDLDEYIDSVSKSGPLYRSEFDSSDPSGLSDVKSDEDAVWSFQPKGVSPDGPLCNVRLVSDRRVWWIVYETFGPFGEHQYYLANYLDDLPPTGEDADAAIFILHRKTRIDGHATFSLESYKYPGRYLVDLGHVLTGAGVRVDAGEQVFILR